MRKCIGVPKRPICKADSVYIQGVGTTGVKRILHSSLIAIAVVSGVEPSRVAGACGRREIEGEPGSGVVRVHCRDRCDMIRIQPNDGRKKKKYSQDAMAESEMYPPAVVVDL